jgi:hypothetical protein
MNVLGEFFSEFDRLVDDVNSTTNEGLFLVYLSQWFSRLETAPRRIRERVSSLFKTPSWDEESGSTFIEPDDGDEGRIRKPANAEEWLGLRLQLFKRIADGRLDTFDWAFNFLGVASASEDEATRQLIIFFLPFAEELRRDLKEYE